MNIWLTIITISSFVFLDSFLEARWIERKAEGWAWYEKENISQKRKRPSSPSEELKGMSLELENKLAAATLEPNEKNIQEYMLTQKRWVEQSKRFANVWAKVLLERPELDPTATLFPVSQYGSRLQKQIVQQKRTQLIQDLSQNYGLFFFYEGNQKASQAAAPVIKEFSDRYQWAVLPIAIDNAPLSIFKKNEKNNGMVERLQINVFPALYIYNIEMNEAVPIAYGLVSLDQIERNISLMFTKEK